MHRPVHAREGLDASTNGIVAKSVIDFRKEPAAHACDKLIRPARNPITVEPEDFYVVQDEWAPRAAGDDVKILQTFWAQSIIFHEQGFEGRSRFEVINGSWPR